jgi:hypothetical protein
MVGFSRVGGSPRTRPDGIHTENGDWGESRWSSPPRSRADGWPSWWDRHRRSPGRGHRPLHRRPAGDTAQHLNGPSEQRSKETPGRQTLSRFGTAASLDTARRSFRDRINGYRPFSFVFMCVSSGRGGRRPGRRSTLFPGEGQLSALAAIAHTRTGFIPKLRGGPPAPGTVKAVESILVEERTAAKKIADTVAAAADLAPQEQNREPITTR